jgi:hypothetical protein
MASLTSPTTSTSSSKLYLARKLSDCYRENISLASLSAYQLSHFPLFRANPRRGEGKRRQLIIIHGPKERLSMAKVCLFIAKPEQWRKMRN